MLTDPALASPGNERVGRLWWPLMSTVPPTFASAVNTTAVRLLLPLMKTSPSTFSSTGNEMVVRVLVPGLKPVMLRSRPTVTSAGNERSGSPGTSTSTLPVTAHTFSMACTSWVLRMETEPVMVEHGPPPPWQSLGQELGLSPLLHSWSPQPPRLMKTLSTTGSPSLP